MKITDIEIERAIERILGLETPKKEPEKPKRPRGRVATRCDIPVWSLSFYEPKKNRTFALISMCIKEDYGQSIKQLALRVAMCKSRPPSECLGILKRLESHGLLGYYDDNRMFRIWRREEAHNGLEDLCG